MSFLRQGPRAPNGHETVITGDCPMHPCALLIVDAIADFGSPRGEALLRQARRVVPRIAALKERMKRAGAAVIYANDNHGQWRWDFRHLVERCGAEGRPGADVVRALAPAPDDYFVLKPRPSPFFQTPLATLLRNLGVDTMVIAGFSGDGGVLAAATDAQMRDYRVIVPADAIASESPERTRRALSHMKESLNIDTRLSPRSAERALMAEAEAD